MRAIADTGFLVAFANRNDSHHAWAAALASDVTEPLLTCEAVLAEAAFHLRSTSLVFELVQDGLVKPAFEAIAHLERLREIANQFADRAPDFADVCLVRMSELHPRLPVVTTDRADFSVYRRNRRERIPLLLPPL